MAEIKTTISIRDAQTGSLMDITKKIIKLHPTSNQASIIDVITTPAGDGFIPGDILKESKRTQTELVAASAVGHAPSFVGASSIVYGKESTYWKSREDNILVQRHDVEKIKEAQGGSATLANKTNDFILTGKELDLKETLKNVRTKASTLKIYTAVTKAQAADYFATVANGVQPAQATDDTAGALAAITGGRRIVASNDLDAKEDNRMNLIREALGYLNYLGTEKGAEQFYPWSINGISLSNVRIITHYKAAIKIKDSFTTTVINLNNPNQSRNFNGLVSYVDTTPVYLTNQSSADNEYIICSNRIAVRKLDPKMQFIGTFNTTATSIVMKDGKAQNVSPDQAVLQYQQARILGAYYYEEAIFIDKK